MPNTIANPFVHIRTEQIGADLSKVVDRISKQYDRPDISFQKEAIQNSWDVRKDRREGKEWGINIYEYRDLNNSVHIVVEDYGTEGMDKKRWVGFSSLWRPEKDHSDAGGKGQGKFVLMNASREHIILVESISNDTGYICKFLQNEVKSKDDENLSIADYIPGARPLDHKGTRLWVYNARDVFLRTLHSSEFLDSIVESWWQILGQRFQAKIKVFGQEISCPLLPPVIEEITLLENYLIKSFSRIKRLRLAFYADNVPGAFEGIRVQRANMTIIKLPFDIHDKEYQGRFSGYIEFDEKLEKELKDIERNDHCNFLYDSPWKEIKNLIKEEADKFVSKIVPSKEQRKTINIKKLSEVIQKANQIINEYCPEILGGGTLIPPITPKPKPPVRIKHLTVNKREAKWGDTIRLNCGILNTTAEYKKVSLQIVIKRLGEKAVEEEYFVKIKPGESKSMRLTELKLDKNKFDKGKYTARVTLRENKKDLDTKSTSFYLESKREPVKRGFIKGVHPYELDEPIRNKPVRGGILVVNFSHKDFLNLYNEFEGRPNIQNKQIGFYIIKLCLDEAAKELFKLKLKDNNTSDIDDIIEEVKEIQDKMYYDVYA